MRGIERKMGGAARLAPRQLLAASLGMVAVLVCFLGFGAQLASAAEPTVTINPNPKVDYTQVEVSGEVNPHGGFPAKVYAESYLIPGGPWEYEPPGGERLGETNQGSQTPEKFSGIITGLEASSEYDIRIDAEREGEHFSPELTITTPPVAAPTLTLAAPSAVTSRSATFSGTVDPNAPDPEGSTTPGEREAFASSWRFECTPACPGLEGTVGADDSAHPVGAEATGLEPGVTYEVSLVAKNAGGTTTAGPRPFTTPLAPPALSKPTATEVGASSATLHAQIDPGGAETEYHFEYITEAQYLADGSQFGPGVVSTPSPPARLITELNQVHEVSASIDDLTPGTTYFFRAVASHAATGDPVIASAYGSLIAYGGATGPSGSCPNEALRAENGSLALPDCRAYEQVTPVFKGGASFSVEPSFVGDGPRLSLSTFATFGGTPSAESTGAAYEFDRTASGWVTSPLLPSATQFERTAFQTPLYRGIDGSSLLGLRPVGSRSDELDFYLRTATSLSEIGPSFPPASLVGKPGQISSEPGPEPLFLAATPNASHLIFAIGPPLAPFFHDYRWPFDQTAEGKFVSTYEYSGTGNHEPFLVGVNGGEGSSALIGDCGTSLGSPGSADTYNAISADGSVVFFTPTGEDALSEPCPGPAGAPATTELYARVDGETAAAHTVRISEPSHSDCSACQVEESQTELKDATFQGASEDGSKVFFLSDQELLSGNPGRNLYEYDFDAPPGDKVSAVSHSSDGAEASVLGVVRVSEDGSHVYFVATGRLTGDANSTGATASVGGENLYADDTRTGTIRFVATLAPSDSSLWAATDKGRQAEATPDGRFLLFASVADLTPDDSSTVSQLFRYDSATGSLVRVSVGRNGYNDNGNTNQDPVTLPPFLTNFRSTAPQSSMSSDGSEIFFTSSKALTPQAIEHYELPGNIEVKLAQNVYEFQEGTVSLISDGRDFAPEGHGGFSAVRLLGTDSSGEDVLFTTSSPLVPNDRDRAVDIYDARIDGGFTLAYPAQCFSDGCQLGVESQTGVPNPGSTSYDGPANPIPHNHKARRRKHKRRHRPARHHRTARHHRNASSQRRGSK
jgi:hypothetical protein